MYWDRFDICEAWWLFLSEYHGGKSSPEYSRLSILSRYFRPSPMLGSFENLTENGQEIYCQLVARWRDELPNEREQLGYSHACGYHD